MYITAPILFALYGLAVVSVLAGAIARYNALTSFGAALFILGGFVVLTSGVTVQTGQQTYTEENVTDTSYFYEQNTGTFTNGLGALSLLIGGALFFYVYDDFQRAKKRARNSVEVPDE